MKNVTLELLSSPGCHNCAKFLEFWETEKTNWPNVTLRELSIVDPDGQELVQKHQIFASPGVLLNGELFSTGGVSQDAFREKLAELSKE